MTTAELFEELKKEQEQQKSQPCIFYEGYSDFDDFTYRVVKPEISYLCYNHAVNGDYDQSLLEDFMIECLEGKYESHIEIGTNYIVEMAQLDGANIAKLQDAVIKYGGIYTLCNFAKEVHNCDRKLLEKPFFDRISEAAEFNENTYKKICEFVEVCGIDISIYEDQIINSIRKTIKSYATTIEEKGKEDRHYCDIDIWLKKNKAEDFLYELYKDFKNINIDKLRDTLIELDCFRTMITFAKNIESETIERFIDDVIAKKGLNSIYDFAYELEEYGGPLWQHNIMKLQDAIIATNNIYIIAKFTRFKGADIEKLEKVIYEKATGEQLNNYYDTYIHEVHKNNLGNIFHHRRETNYEALCIAAIRTEHSELINKILKDLEEQPTLISIEVLNKCIENVKGLVKKSKSFDTKIILYFLKNEEINKEKKEELVDAIIESAKEHVTAKQVKNFIELNIHQKEIENVVCEIGDSEDIYDTAIKEYNEKDLNKLIQAIITRGDAEYIFAFAVNVKGLSNIEKLRLMKKSIELIEKYGESEAGFVNEIKFNPINK